MSTAKKGSAAKKPAANKSKTPPLPELRIPVSRVNDTLSIPDICVAMPLTIIFYFDPNSLSGATFDGLPAGTSAFAFSAPLPTSGEFGKPSVDSKVHEVHVTDYHAMVMTRSYVLAAVYKGKTYTTSSAVTIAQQGGPGGGIIINK
ncbi:MAG: hypothetical protein JSS44_00980 [Proteobacteria bacterium]|nr:hypothetical protein [Pseudomonadota bacterium]MBS0464180.1 hypothetical protein [Pseudomonadota bacterium]